MKKNSCIFMTLAFSVALSSCAGPENYLKESSRNAPRAVSKKNKVPDFKSQGFNFRAQSSRVPASSASGTSVEKIPSAEQSLSNKKLYFLTLLGQYEGLKKYAQDFEPPKLNICPHFHTSLLEHRSRRPSLTLGAVSFKNNKKFIYDSTQLSNPQYVAMRPELALPMAKDEITPKVVDIIRSKDEVMTDDKMNGVIHEAMDNHLVKTFAEIHELCEFGASNNYYIYENLITHIKNSDFVPSEKNMDTLLKTTIFSNFALMTSLDNTEASPMRSVASVAPKAKEASAFYTNEVISRLGVEWTREYFDYLKSSK